MVIPMKLVNMTNNSVIAPKVAIADNLIEPLKGSVGKKELLQEECLLMISCNIVHTCFRKFSIDAIFLDKNWNVVKIVSELKPWRFIAPVKNTQFVVEFLGGTLRAQELRVEEGDYLKLEA